MEYLIALSAVVILVATGFRWWHWREYKRRHADRELFLTHTPQAFRVGDAHEGARITRIERTSPTALAAGGSAPCWVVFGIGGFPDPKDVPPMPRET